MTDAVLTPGEAADYLKLTQEEFHELQAGPRPIPTFAPIPGTTRILLRVMEAWIDETCGLESALCESPRGPHTGRDEDRALVDPTATLRTGPRRRYPEHKLAWMPY